MAEQNTPSYHLPESTIEDLQKQLDSSESRRVQYATALQSERTTLATLRKEVKDLKAKTTNLGIELHKVKAELKTTRFWHTRAETRSLNSEHEADREAAEHQALKARIEDEVKDKCKDIIRQRDAAENSRDVALEEAREAVEQRDKAAKVVEEADTCVFQLVERLEDAQDKAKSLEQQRNDLAVQLEDAIKAYEELAEE